MKLSQKTGSIKMTIRITDDKNGVYAADKKIRFKVLLLKISLYNYSDPYTLV